MKKIKLLLLFFPISYGIVFCQNDYNEGISITYKVSVNKSKNDKSKPIDKTDKIVQDISKSIDELEYLLFCNYNSSIYFLNRKLKIKESFVDRMALRVAGKDLYYKSIVENIKILQRELSGEKFNIIYPFIQDEWVLTKEIKIINGYTCYKATSYREEFDYIKNLKKVFYPEVWFAPEIPLPFGPRGLDGLPGLVLEGTINGKTFYYASKINFNCDDCSKVLKKPEKGIEILKDDYFKLIAERNKD